MRVQGIIGVALAGVLLAPATAWAGPNGDGICDLHPGSLYCASQTHQVERGEWLWKIARTTLAQELQSTATPNVRKIADMIYADNRRIIGPNKNRLRIGQRLTIRARQNWPRLNN
jgi:hypothetical protein